MSRLAGPEASVPSRAHHPLSLQPKNGGSQNPLPSNALLTTPDSRRARTSCAALRPAGSVSGLIRLCSFTTACALGQDLRPRLYSVGPLSGPAIPPSVLDRHHRTSSGRRQRHVSLSPLQSPRVRASASPRLQGAALRSQNPRKAIERARVGSRKSTWEGSKDAASASSVQSHSYLRRLRRGTRWARLLQDALPWIPACAGMTSSEGTTEPEHAASLWGSLWLSTYRHSKPVALSLSYSPNWT
jgi:hypothetical protein